MEAEAVRLKAEVQVVQNEEGGHDSLEGRLKDFEVLRRARARECSNFTG